MTIDMTIQTKIFLQKQNRVKSGEIKDIFKDRSIQPSIKKLANKSPNGQPTKSYSFHHFKNPSFHLTDFFFHKQDPFVLIVTQFESQLVLFASTILSQ